MSLQSCSKSRPWLTFVNSGKVPKYFTHIPCEKKKTFENAISEMINRVLTQSGNLKMVEFEIMKNEEYSML